MYSVVYNDCFGGFGLSDEAIIRYHELKGVQIYNIKTEFLSYFFYEDLNGRSIAQMQEDDAEQFYCWELDRHDPILVQVVQELGEKANGDYANLAIQQISGNRYRIDEYDGQETVIEPNDIDWIVVGENPDISD